MLGLSALKSASGTFVLIRLSVKVVWLAFSRQGKLEPSCLVRWLLFCLYFVMFELICYYGCMVWLALLFGCGNVIVQGNSGEKRVFSPKRACLAQTRFAEQDRFTLNLSLRGRALVWVRHLAQARGARLSENT